MLDQENNFMFVHIPKTAGQSIRDELITLFQLQARSSEKLLIGKNDGLLDAPPHLDHCSYMEILKLSGMSQVSTSKLFKFSFVRNPVDRAISIYKFWGSRHETFDSFVKKKLFGELWDEHYYFVRPQTNFIIDNNNELAMDFIGKVENISSDWQQVLKFLGVDSDAQFRHSNSSEKINFKIPKSKIGLKYWLISVQKKLRRLQPSFSGSINIDPLTRELIYKRYERDFDLLRY